MVLLFGDYLTNPYGKGSTIPAAMIRDTVERDKSTYPTAITWTTYRTRDEHLIYHVKLPSRTKRDVFYDVVIDCDVQGSTGTKQNIAHYPIKVFSNSPSFMYTFAKAFEEQDCFCTWLKRKYDPKVMRKDPKARNPNRILGYERTIYASMSAILEETRRIPASDQYANALPTTYRELARIILGYDTVADAYNAADDTDRERERKEGIAQRKAERAARKDGHNVITEADGSQMDVQKSAPATTRASIKSSKVPKVKRTQSIKKTSSTAKMKRIGRR